MKADGFAGESLEVGHGGGVVDIGFFVASAVGDDVFAGGSSEARFSRRDAGGFCDFSVFVVGDFLLGQVDDEVTDLVFVFVGDADEELLHFHVGVGGGHLDGIDSFFGSFVAAYFLFSKCEELLGDGKVA